MKSNLFHLIFVLLLVGFINQGFQCGSPDFTGAKVQEQNKNYPEAIRLYEIEVKKNPMNEEAWFRLGFVKGETGDLAGMSDAFTHAITISDAHASDIKSLRFRYWAMHLNAGVAFIQRASKDSTIFYDNAIAEYQQSIVAWPDTSLTYRYLAVVYVDKNDIDSAIYNLEKSWTLGHDRDAYKAIGRLYVKRGMDLESMFDTTNADLLQLKKNLIDIKKGSYKSDVIHAFGEPSSKSKDKKNPKKEEWSYSKYGIKYSFEGDFIISEKVTKPYDFKNIDSTKYFEAMKEYNKAVDIFETLKAEDPKDNENLNLLLSAYVQAKRINEATKAFKIAVENEPGNKLNHYILGTLYRTVLDYDAAIAEFNEALKLDPEFTDAIYDIGATYYNWGVKMKKASQEKGDESVEYKTKFQAALPWMIKMTEIKKDDPKIWESLGTIYALLGQADNATKALDEADKVRKAGK
jgi:tetratricopeptide (TPR) repeat protein